MIRQANPGDEANIRDCAEQAYRRYVPIIGRKPAPMVAADGDTFQGFIVFFPKGDHVLLENVAVLPSAAGRGIGRSLIGFCEEQARRGGFPAVRLYTNEKMVENLTLYPRLGYAEVARRTEDGFSRVYFEKTVSGPGA